MTLHDTESLIVETSGAAESLPDAATYPQRTHDLTNTGAVTAVWSAAGAGFTEAGTNVATISVPSGSSKRVASNGTRWAVIQPAGTRRIASFKGVTDANGLVTFTFTPPFATIPVVSNAVETGTADATECRVTALSASSVTFAARRSPAVTVLGISVLSASVPLVGATVHCHAAEAGQGV